MDRAIAVIPIIALLTIGLVRLFRAVAYIREKMSSAKEFLEKFRTYLNSQGKDYQTYAWLIQRSPRIQSEMGSLGYLASYRPPYANYMFSDYAIILNVIPEIRKEFEDPSYSRNVRALNDYGALIQESLLRHLGFLSDIYEAKSKRLRNPVIWLTEGVSWLLLLPISVLNWVGAIGETLVQRIASNTLFKIVAAILTILSAFSSVMTIVVGWNSFLETVKKILAQ